MNHKTTFKFTLLLAFLLLTLNVNLMPLVMGNRAEIVYVEPLTKLSALEDSIEGKIIRAAGHFFAGRAQIQKLLVMIELKDTNGLNSASLDPVLGAALLNIQKSKDLYVQIVKQADLTPYNPVTLSQLKEFPYDQLQVREGLNRTIFAQVRNHLSNGNVTSFFRDMVQQLNGMVSLLKKIKRDFRAGKVPEIALFWKLNETASEVAMAGSYVARVFAQIK